MMSVRYFIDGLIALLSIALLVVTLVLRLGVVRRCQMADPPSDAG